MAAWLQRRILQLFRRISRTSLWFETRFSNVGRLLIGGALAAAIFGIDPRQTMAFLLAAILLGAVIVAMLCSLHWRHHIKIARVLPDTVTVGIEASYYLMLTNLGTRPETGLELDDRLLTRYPTVAMLRERWSDDQSAASNWFDRRVGFPRWLDLLRRNRGARLDTSVLPPLFPGQSTKLLIKFTPLRRGKIVFTTVLLKRPDPLHIFSAIQATELYGELISLPRRYPLPAFRWASRRRFHLGGLALAATVGDSEEFIGLRDYRPGDPLRHIHWRSFAKHGKPVIKEHQDEYFDRHALLLDTFAPTGSTAEFETAVAVAASFIQSPRPSDSILDLVFLERQVWRLSSGRGLTNNLQILTQLAELKATPVDEFAHLSAYMARYLDQLASLIMVGVAWNDQRDAYVSKLRQRGMRCVVLRISASDDQRLAASGGIASATEVHAIRPDFVSADLARIPNIEI